MAAAAHLLDLDCAQQVNALGLPHAALLGRLVPLLQRARGKRVAQPAGRGPTPGINLAFLCRKGRGGTGSLQHQPKMMALVIHTYIQSFNVHGAQRTHGTG